MTLFDLDEYLVPEPQVWLIPVCIWCNQPIARIEIDGGAGAPWGAAEKWGYVAMQSHLATCPSCPDDRRPTPHHCDGCPDSEAVPHEEGPLLPEVTRRAGGQGPP